MGLSWGVSRHVLDIPWRPAPGLLALGALLTMVLVGIVGDRRERRRPPQKTAGDAQSRVARSDRQRIVLLVFLPRRRRARGETVEESRTPGAHQVLLAASAARVS